MCGKEKITGELDSDPQMGHHVGYLSPHWNETAGIVLSLTCHFGNYQIKKTDGYYSRE